MAADTSRCIGLKKKVEVEFSTFLKWVGRYKNVTVNETWIEIFQIVKNIQNSIFWDVSAGRQEFTVV